MSKSDIWFPFYIGDYLSDTMHLTDAEHGRYLLLLLAYYKNRGPLPDDDDQLASTCKVTLSVWSACRSKLAKFFQIRDGEWHHTRADFEIKRAKSMQDARIKGAKSTNAKLGRGTLTDTLSDTLSDTPGVVQSQSQSHKKGEGENGAPRRPPFAGNGHGQLTPSERITREKELERVEKRLSVLRSNREQWNQSDRDELKKLKTRQAQLVGFLGMSV